MLKILSSWLLVGIVVPLLIGVGFSVMSMNPPAYNLAEVLLSAAALFLLAKVGWWIAYGQSDGATVAYRLVLSFIVFGAIGMLWVWSLAWVNARRELALRAGRGAQSQPAVAIGKSAPARSEVQGPSMDQLPSQAITPNEINPAKTRLENDPNSVTLHDLFLTDFDAVQQRAIGGIFVDDAKKISVQYSINVELESRSKFLTFYIPAHKHTAEICTYLVGQYKFVLDHAPQLLLEQKMPGDSGTMSTKEAVFSNRIYVYHETYLPPEQTVELTKLYKAHRISVILRSVDYLSNKKLEANLRKLRRNQAAP